ncbi:hypothetical protein G7Y89_g15431 [Cudoniella acicularis]|uniref:Fungal-specific transcription factor domain-containing protein n=1 Tax=Cudoniella acicularis TaxID=354080 RepID=A0A8H4VLU9_9HELO|nr:hypothetical protein G7Y89_g15431 [Cudoniella acicularis]
MAATPRPGPRKANADTSFHMYQPTQSSLESLGSTPEYVRGSEPLPAYKAISPAAGLIDSSIEPCSSSARPSRPSRPSSSRTSSSADIRFKIVTGRPTKRARIQKRKGEGRFKLNPPSNADVSTENAFDPSQWADGVTWMPDLSWAVESVDISTIPGNKFLSRRSTRVLIVSVEPRHPLPIEAISQDVVTLNALEQWTVPLQGPGDSIHDLLQDVSDSADDPEYAESSATLCTDGTPDISSTRTWNMPSTNQQFDLELPRGVLFGTWSDKFHEVLAHYDRDLCIIPLTADCGLNPFRVRKETSSGSQFLLHAVLAHSLYHLTRQSDDALGSALLQRHRSTAFHLFCRALGDSSSTEQKVAFLDTALLLMCLDASQSASGVYNIHLKGVRTIIEAAGGPQILIPRMPKLRSQLAMFIWYDTTIAMISRESPTLPITYLQGIILHGRADGWDYFNLVGCREEFIIAMCKLAKLAMQYERAQGMEYLLFDTTGVDEVEEVLRQWPTKAPRYDSNLAEEVLETERDRYHCEEAWRNAVLLYIERVFRWKREEPVQGTVRYLSRLVLDHARSIRQVANHPIQKQVLLPVFLAAAEMRSHEYREFARSYCEWWNRSCGWKMFKDVYSYLQEIWDEGDSSNGTEVWWATIIDRRRQGHQEPLSPQILMG